MAAPQAAAAAPRRAGHARTAVVVVALLFATVLAVLSFEG
ncbi:hypothetical protein Gpo141_00006060, partial [Globisporangium polare]